MENAKHLLANDTQSCESQLAMNQLCDLGTLTVDGFNFLLSEESIKLLGEHDAFSSAGPEWLSCFDPKGNKEQDIFDRLKASVLHDLHVATVHLPAGVREDLINKLSDTGAADLFLKIKDQ